MKHSPTRLFLATTLATLLFAANASAGTYTQYACHLPDGSVAPTDNFTSTTGGLGTVGNDCAAGGGMSITLPETSEPQQAWGTWHYAVPPGTSVEKLSYVRVIRNIATTGDGSTRMFTGPNSDACGLYAPCDETATVDAAQPSEPVEFHAHCEYQPCHGTATGDGLAAVDHLAITLRDEHAPTFASDPSGDLFVSDVISGTRTVTFTAEDVGGGVYTSSLIVDGTERPAGTIDTNAGACVEPFVRAVPCRATATGSLALDTTTLTDGPHNVSVVVYDATASNRAVFGPVPVNVDNVPDDHQTDSSSTAGSAVRSVRLVGVGFAAQGAGRQAYGRPSTLRGKLLTRDGNGVAGAPLTVYSRTDVPGANEELVGHITTDRNGAFSFDVKKGPSRYVTVRYAGTDPSDQAAWTFHILVPAPLALVASASQLRNGQMLVLSTRLAGGPVPARSAAVAFQVQIGDQWRTFATRNVNRRGVAHVGHRFRVTYQRLVYRFRAVVVGRRSFPFANATSRPIAVTLN